MVKKFALFLFFAVCLTSSSMADQLVESPLGFKLQLSDDFKVAEANESAYVILFVGQKPFSFQPVINLTGRQIKGDTTQTKMIPLIANKFGYKPEQIGQFKSKQGLVFETFTAERVTEKNVKYQEKYYFLYDKKRSLNINVFAGLPGGSSKEDFAKFVEPALDRLELTDPK